MDDKPLDDPTHELACQCRAKGMTQTKAYEAAGFNESGQGNNSSRFFRQPHIQRRVSQIKRNAAIMAELDQGFVLRNLMTVAKLADANLADYFEKDADGRRTKTSIADVSRAKMHALDEVTVEESIETDDEGDELRRIRKTKLKLRPLSVAIHATELLGKHLGMWPASSTVKAEVSGPNGGPVEYRKAADLTDDELAAIVAAGSVIGE